MRTFAAHAGGIAAAIAAAHPNTEMTFGLVDYFATLSGASADDGDGYQYHVDVGNFTSAAGFAKAVNDSLLNGSHPVLQAPNMILGDSDMGDNFLTTSSISALYFALLGASLAWSNESHHVLADLGSSAPQDPHYPENICVSPSSAGSFFSNCTLPTCEPSAAYGTLTTPGCVGWVVPAVNSTNGSIANFSRSTPACANSAGRDCTIDAVDVWTTPTDPYSAGWPTGRGSSGGPGGNATIADATNILQAGCDIANATGGSWDGPNYFSCNGTAGTLNYSGLTPNDRGLLAALTNLSLGDPATIEFSALPTSPLLQVVIAPGVALPQTPLFSAVCSGPGSPSDCPQAPVISTTAGLVVLQWNWSTSPTTNLLVSSDLWTVSFDLVAGPGSSGATPLYLCSASPCLANGAGPTQGASSMLMGLVGAGPLGTPWNGSLPFSEVQVESPQPFTVDLGSGSSVGEAPFNVTFNLSLAGGVSPFGALIDFGDGYDAVGITPVTHTYGTGTFTASARATDSLGTVAVSSRLITVLPALQGWMVSNLSTGSAPLAVSFTGEASAGQAPYTYVWSFGDGGTSQLAAPVHTFLEVGNWTVVLTVTDGLGYTQTSTEMIIVQAPPTPPQNPTPIHLAPPHANASGSSGPPSYLPYAGVALAAGALAIAVLAYRARQKGRPPASRTR